MRLAGCGPLRGPPPALWGLGLGARSQGGYALYLHDGRAKSLREAIDYHGGEAAASRTAFRGLTAELQVSRAYQV